MFCTSVDCTKFDIEAKIGDKTDGVVEVDVTYPALVRRIWIMFFLSHNEHELKTEIQITVQHVMI